MNTSDVNFRQGDSVTIEVSNRPYVDMGIPPSSQEFRWVDFSNIKIYCPPDNISYQEVNLDDLPELELVVDDAMKINSSRVGWYLYRFPLPCDAPVGLWKVVITLSSFVALDTPTDSTSVCTTGAPLTGSPTTGSPDLIPEGYELHSAVSVRHFRVLRSDIY